MKSNFLFIGHRGVRINYDENTIEAFEIALNHGANYIELDIRESKDGKLFVIHDSSLDRTTNGFGLIRDYNYSEIVNLTTKSKNCKIPLLTEVLENFKNKSGFIIELKDFSSWSRAVNVVISENLVQSTIFSGRSLNMLKLIKKKLPEIQICYNITKGKELTLKNFLEKRNLDKNFFLPDMISLKSNLIDNKFIKICHRYKMLALTWDFINYKNPVERIKYFISLGIDGILFDDYRNIKIIKKYLNTR